MQVEEGENSWECKSEERINENGIRRLLNLNVF
jgi:hypothetical protein